MVWARRRRHGAQCRVDRRPCGSERLRIELDVPCVVVFDAVQHEAVATLVEAYALRVHLEQSGAVRGQLFERLEVQRSLQESDERGREALHSRRRGALAARRLAAGSHVADERTQRTGTVGSRRQLHEREDTLAHLDPADALGGRHVPQRVAIVIGQVLDRALRVGRGKKRSDRLLAESNDLRIRGRVNELAPKWHAALAAFATTALAAFASAALASSAKVALATSAIAASAIAASATLALAYRALSRAALANSIPKAFATSTHEYVCASYLPPATASAFVHGEGP